MKNIIFIIICLILLNNLFSDEIKGYDNLIVAYNPIIDTNCVVNETEPGINTIKFDEKSNVFSLLLTLYPIENKFKINDVKNSLENSGKKLLSGAEEKSINIISILDNSIVNGYYYMLTDKNPEKGGFKYMLQGYIKYKYFAGYFTFLFNEKNNVEIFNKINIQKLITETSNINKTINFEKIKFNENELNNYQLQYIKQYYQI